MIHSPNIPLFRFISPEAKHIYRMNSGVSASGEEKQKEILDSIHYAKRIQQSLLPNEKYISKNLYRLNKFQ